MRIPHLSSFLAYSVIGTITLMPLLVLPAMIGVLVDNAGMSDSTAGWSASVGFLASAIAGLMMSLRIHHLDLRRVAVVTLLLAIVADLASAATAGDSMMFFVARALSGIGLGAAYVAAVSSFARFDGFERGFGIFVMMQFIVSGLGLYVVPVYADQIGARGLFFAFALLDMLALVMTRALPTERASGELGSDGVSELKVLLTASALLAIIGFAIFEAANNAQFTYVERFGVALNIPDEEIGFSLLIASFMGIPGAFAIVLFGQRFGTLLPLLFGIAIAVVGLLVLINATTYPAYFFGSCCLGFSWAFCLPFIQTLLTVIDRKGSAIAAGTAFSTFGSAFGPGVAALVVAGGHYDHVFLLSIGLFAVTVVAFVLAARMRRVAS